MSDKKLAAMDPQLYVESLGLESLWEPDSGDQCLIMPDIAACFKDCNIISIPYPCPTLAEHLEEAGKRIVAEMQPWAEAVYWGTPTIVNNRPLFVKSVRPPKRGQPEPWTKEYERSMSIGYTYLAEQWKYKTIVTGLGTGDISVEERLEDMGGGQVVSHKRFGEFEDWVLMRRL
jgi:hypothetical protein